MSSNKQAQISQSTFENLKVVVLAGGVGGAKMADGFAQALPAENLTTIVNTGDDFIHCGLTICPDLDTVTYALAGIENPETGWGRDADSWRAMDELARLGGPDWFKLGDLDLGLHLARSQMLAEGYSLTRATSNLCDHLEIECQVLPMSDEPAPTMIETDDGTLSFQDWFVKQQWQPVVKSVRLPDNVKASAQIVGALEGADLVVFAPSNPFVSIDPILNVYPVREMISDLPNLVAAVSPLIGGGVVKGPAAKMMEEMDLPVASQTIASYYGDLIDVFVYDQRDLQQIGLNDTYTLQTDTLMTSRTDRRRLAGEIIEYTTELINQ